MLNRQKLIRGIDETCNGLNVDHLPDGALVPLNIDGVKVRISKVDNAFLNTVGLADLDEVNYREVIDSVKNRYIKENKIFGWLVGPTSRPVNISKYLIESGLKKVPELTLSGMILEDLSVRIRGNDEFEIKKVEVDDFSRNIALITK
ncbi:hypothetical protein [Caldiplasma sukawensis]